jgi:hypothetical protein
MKTYEGVDIEIYVFLTPTIIESEGSVSRPGRFIPGERAPGTNFIGGWVDPRADLDDMKK